MGNILIDFQTKFNVKEYKVYESQYWIWSLRPHQATLGAGILSLKRECTAFSVLREEEFTDLNKIIKVIEPALKKAFNYDVINYLMLMMFDKHVHYHILPRYENPIDFIKITWEDESWPGIPRLTGESLAQESLDEITSFIKKHI
jgi:diadenosine tetraphosphate (Ap4A) HIT family hydrolase